jgi:chromosome segregation ATPase
MDFKTMAITATLGGTILLSGLTFTGTLDLADIKGFGTSWADKVTQAVNNSKDMASKFNLFKSDVESQINEKIAKINELQSRINELGEEVASGNVNLEDANNEIARLNEELERANTEVEALKNEFASKDAEVQAVFNEMVTADSLDTNLTLDSQTTAPQEPQEEQEPAPQEPQGYTAQETAIYNAMTTKYTGLEDLQVTITDNTITLVEPNLNVHSAFGDGYITTIEQASSIDITQSRKISDTRFEYDY